MVVTAGIIAVLVAYGNVIVVVYIESIILEVGTRIVDVSFNYIAFKSRMVPARVNRTSEPLEFPIMVVFFVGESLRIVVSVIDSLVALLSSVIDTDNLLSFDKK